MCVCGLGFPDQKQGPGISGMLVLVLRGEGHVSSQGVGECIHHDLGACHRSGRRRCLHMAAAAEQGERGRDWAARWPCLPQLPGQWKAWAPGLAWVGLPGRGEAAGPWCLQSSGHSGHGEQSSAPSSWELTASLWPESQMGFRRFCRSFSLIVCGVSCRSLLQGIFPTQGLNAGLLRCRWSLYRLSYQGGPCEISVTLQRFPCWVWLVHLPRGPEWPSGEKGERAGLGGLGAQPSPCVGGRGGGQP